MVSTTNSSRSGDGAPIMMPHSVLNAWVRALTALARLTRSVRITSTIPDLAFGIAVEVWPKDRPSDLLGVEAVGLAVHASGQPVGPVHLDHPLAGLGQCSGQGGTERSGAFDTDGCDLTVSADPGQQCLVAAVGGRKLLVTQQPAMLVDRGRVVGVLVGVDTADNVTVDASVVMLGFAPPLGLTDGQGEPAGRSDRSVTGLLVQAPIRSDPSGRCAP